MLLKEQMKNREFERFKPLFSTFEEMYDNYLQEDFGESEDLNPLIIVHQLSTSEKDLGEAPLIVLN